MSLFTSTHFASAAASGTDWRDTAKNVLEKLESVRTQKDSFNLGFLYISDYLAEDAASILNLFRSVLGIENWVGSIGMGVLGCGEAYIDRPAITALVGKFPDNAFCIFPQTDEFSGSENLDSQAAVKEWLAVNNPMLTVVHVDPMAQDDPTIVMEKLERGSNAFLVGGLTSSRSHHYQIANVVCENAVSGVFFDHNLPVLTNLSQGCAPIGEAHTVTRADEMTILELDGRKALDVFQDDLRAMASKRLKRDVKEFVTDLRSLKGAEHIPDEYMSLFQGQIHVALADNFSDQRDYMVRNITALNADEGSINIAQIVNMGERVLFAERTQDTIIADLRRSLQQIKERAITRQGEFSPKAGLYFSCIARGFSNNPDQNYEMNIIREEIGDLPLAGFYAGGEISNARLYGYTGIMILFL